MGYVDSQRNIMFLAIAAGSTKVVTSYLASIIEALMVGTNFKTAAVAAFFSLPATVINSISTAICVPLLYFMIKRSTPWCSSAEVHDKQLNLENKICLGFSKQILFLIHRNILKILLVLAELFCYNIFC